jgi:hypothetical protein
MMAAPYPPPSQYSVNMSPTHGTPNPGSAHVGHAPFGYPTPSPHPHHSQLYCSPVPEFTTFNNVTPPTVTPSQFGSPLIASGYPHPGGTPTPHQWGTLNALSLSPMGTLDSSIAYGYPHPSPVLGHDPAGAGAGACAAPGEVFSAIPIRHDHMGPDALGFHHPVYPPHPGPVFRGHHGLKAGPNGHIILGVDGQPTGEIKKRSRTAQACERCRIRKARVSPPLFSLPLLRFASVPLPWCGPWVVTVLGG